MKRDDRKTTARLLHAKGCSTREIAALTGWNHNTIARDLRVSKDTEYVSNDTPCPSTTGGREKSRATAEARNAQLRLVEVQSPQKTYGTIVIDPPWEMEKIERVVRPNQVGFDYPIMTEDELARFDVTSMAAEDCHLFCWTTQKWLPISLQLLPRWGFKYVFLMTWHKPGGFQPHGLPQYNSEFVVYARRGNAKFRDTQAFNTCFQAERREHSRKPDAFYETVKRVTEDGRIDVFSREKRDGFDQYGNETGKFDGPVSNRQAAG
jgi:N6-adenosine-specific RNA methylase IME4